MVHNQGEGTELHAPPDQEDDRHGHCYHQVTHQVERGL